MDMSKLQNAINEAAEQTNMNEAETGGGGELRVPEAGLCRLRLITYIERGNHHDETYKKDKDEVYLQFELSGPKHEPFEVSGKKIPFIISITENLSLNEKANFYKLFKRMNHTGEFTHMAQMLGKEFLGTVVLRKSKDGKKTYANLRDDGGYTIRPPYVEDPETGETRKIEVQPALTPLKCFLWNYCDQEQWDSIFIDGRWDDQTDEAGNVVKEGRSKNIHQNRIKEAQNFPGSPAAELLFAGGSADLPDAEKPERKDEAANSNSADPLADVA